MCGHGTMLGAHDRAFSGGEKKKKEFEKGVLILWGSYYKQASKQAAGEPLLNAIIVATASGFVSFLVSGAWLPQGKAGITIISARRILYLFSIHTLLAVYPLSSFLILPHHPPEGGGVVFPLIY